MNLNIFQQTLPVGGGNVLVGAIYKASAPSVLIASYVFPGPYVGATQLHTFTGLVAVVYNYILYESPDGGADGTQLNAFSIQPNISTFNTRDPLTLVANTSPFFASSTNFYGPDPSLIGWNWYPDIPGGIGILNYGVDYVKTVNGTPTAQDDTTANGYQYLATGYLIGDGEKAVLVFLPQLAASTSVSGSVIGATTLLTANTTLTNSAAGEAFLLQGAAPALSIALPATSTMPDNEPIFINSAGGSHVNAGLLAAAGDTFEWYNNATLLGSATRATSLYLGQCESIGLYKWTYPDSTRKWLIFQGGEGMRMVGEFLADYSMVPLNTVFANGQLLSRTAYARLWAWVQASGMTVIADSAFNNTLSYNGISYQVNWGHFTQGDGSTTFRMPRLWTYGYIRLKSGASGSGSGNGFPGDFVPPAVLNHYHTMHAGGPITGGAGSLYLAHASGGRYSGGGGDSFGGQAIPDTSMITGTPQAGGGNAYNTAGENLTANTGIYGLFRC